jgi:polo-like kinase 1
VAAFALLTGHPPFETAHTKLTYEHIKSCQYKFPSHITISRNAKDFIRSILQIDPERRPSAQDLLEHPFLSGTCDPPIARPRAVAVLPDRGLAAVPAPAPKRAPPPPVAIPEKPEEPNAPVPEKRAEPETLSVPPHCIARFCDHSDKYGLGYLLMDGTVGACFNDLSRMVMDPHETFVQYWETYQTITPELMNPVTCSQPKKLSLLKRFSESLKKTKSMFDLPDRHYSEASPLKHVKYWMRNQEATLFRLDDRNIQVNFNDRCKLIIFWNAKKMMCVRNIRDIAPVLPISEITGPGPLSDERRRFNIAKEMLAEMSAR